jgi:hypothetical protein
LLLLILSLSRDKKKVFEVEDENDVLNLNQLKGVDSQSTKEEEKVFENEKKEKSKNGQIWKKDKVSDVKGGDRFIKTFFFVTDSLAK